MFWLAKSCQVIDSLEPSHFTILAVTRKTPKTKHLTLISPYEIYSLNKERYILLKHCQKWEGAVHMMMMMMTWWYITPQENSGTQVKSSWSIQVMLVSNYMYFETWKQECASLRKEMLDQFILEGIVAVNFWSRQWISSFSMATSGICSLFAKYTPHTPPPSPKQWYRQTCDLLTSPILSETVTWGSLDSWPMPNQKNGHVSAG